MSTRVQRLTLQPSTKGPAISALFQFQPRSTCVASTARAQSRRKILRRKFGWKALFPLRLAGAQEPPQKEPRRRVATHCTLISAAGDGERTCRGDTDRWMQCACAACGGLIATTRGETVGGGESLCACQPSQTPSDQRALCNRTARLQPLSPTRVLHLPWSAARLVHRADSQSDGAIAAC